MKQVRVGLIFMLVIVIAQPGLAFAWGRPLGTIAGMVRDDQGRPISGALVKLIDAAIAISTIRSIEADQQGNFYARNILPGAYRLRAEARGFMADVKPVEVKPDVVLSLRFELKRIDTLLDQRADRDDYRWTVRGVSRPVLRLKGEEETPTEVAANTGQSLSPPRRVNGLVQVMAGVPLSSLSPSDSFTGVNVALAGHAAANLELVFVGQVSSSAGFPSRLQMAASTFANDTHQLTASVGYARLRAIGESLEARGIKQVSLALVDSWQVAGPVMIIYGVDLAHYLGGNSPWVASPRVGVTLAANGKTRLSADYFPVSAQEIQKQGEFNYEGGRVVFADPQDLALVGKGAQADRRRRLQFAVERQLDEDSSIEAALFFDEFSGRGVGLLAVPIDTAGEVDNTWHSLVQQGQAKGARVTYKRALTSFLTGLVGYSVGQGQKLASGGRLEPADGFQDGRFQVLSLRLDANLTRTRTRVSSTYRLASRDAAFAIDPFYGRVNVFNPSLNVVLTQELPAFGILPGHWEASLDARNLFDKRDSVASDGRALLLSRAQRSIRGSVSVRF